MKYFITAALALLLHVTVYCQQNKSFQPVLSVGSRNTLSAFNEDNAIGKGIGAQARIQFGKRLNSEWYLDYITSKSGLTARNDYHIGWSLLFYTKGNYNFTNIFQPYLIVGHCFDKTEVFELNNKSHSVSRISMATQAGLGTHVNITTRLDCSLSGQYMLHLGKEIEVNYEAGKPVIYKADHSHLDGHLLFTVSFNYKLFFL